TLVRWLGSALYSGNAEPDATGIGPLARAYRRWAAIIGALILLVLTVNSQAAKSLTETGTALVAAIVGFVPMLEVAHGLRHGRRRGRTAAFALPLCQIGFTAVLLSGAGPVRSLSLVGQFVRGVVVVQLFQCPVTAVL